MESNTTVQGCLSSSSNGTYTLTDKNGNAYMLSGDTSKLSEHVGHEMKITGTTTGSATAGTQPSGNNEDVGNGSTAKKTIQVTSFKHISKTCQSR